jgi:hypothetical protein
MMDFIPLFDDEEEDDDDDDRAGNVLFYCCMSYVISHNQTENVNSTRFDGSSLEYRRNNSGTIRRKSLQNPSDSVFWKMYNSKQDDGLIQLCGLDHNAFDHLLCLFKPIYDHHTPHTDNNIQKINRNHNGRPRGLDATAAMGLVLTWLRSNGGHRVLCFLFGILKSTCSVWLRFGKRCLIKCLRSLPESKVRMPTSAEVESYCAMINRKYENLGAVWGAMDGLKIMMQQAGDSDTQNMFYNGWKCDHYISNLFLFSPDGRICACYFNAPGSVHDSTMAELSGIYNKIDLIYRQTGAKVVVDSAFAKKGRPSLIKSNADNIDGQGRARQSNLINREATSVRQLSEWGMRGLQGSFPRLKDRIPYEERGERKQLLQLVVLLFNYRTEKVGFNQIKTVYTQSLQSTANDLVRNRSNR